MKECNRCRIEKEFSEFHSIKKYSKKKGEYVYYFPYCKECNKSKVKEWRKENPEKLKEQWAKRDQKPDVKERKKVFNLNRRKNGKYREWQQNNPDKVKKYNLYRSQHKQHDLTELEWNHCKNYFNNLCAYCGIDEIMSNYLYNNNFHKDHVKHDGANDLSNCVPACKGCNGSKHTFELTDWYNPKNEIFVQERLDRIEQWLNEDHKMYIRKELLT